MPTAVENKCVADVFLGMLENEIQITRRVLDCVPDAQLDFKLGEKGRTAREIMWHIITSEVWFGEGIAAGAFSMEGGPDAPATKAEMLAFYDRQAPAMLEKCRKLTAEQLAKPVNFFNVMNLPAAMYMGLMINHTVHHRGQLSIYLRALNAHVPDIYGGSADEPFQMPTATA